MTVHNPPHPGEGLREDVLPKIKMTVTALTKYLDYSRVQLSNVLHCRAAISADLAWRLELAGLGRARRICGLVASLPTTCGRPSTKTCRRSPDCTRPKDSPSNFGQASLLEASMQYLVSDHR